jgi:hypothetical protein
MKITNKLGLPEPFVIMATSDYQITPKRYSVTTLLKPTREILLMRRYGNEIEQDCSNMIWMLFGSAVHHILEKSNGADTFAEEKLYHTLPNGYTISGIIDLYDMEKKEIVDYKTASVWKAILGDFKDWERQGQAYAWLLHKNGLECEKAKFYAILRDWSQAEASRKADYPQNTIVAKEFQTTDLTEIDTYLNAKIEELIKYESMQDNELPLCSEEDRWKSADKYAVMKNGRKSALRVLDTEEEALDYQKQNGGDRIEKRKGEDRKCKDYCLCKTKCDYWKQNYMEEITE